MNVGDRYFVRIDRKLVATAVDPETLAKHLSWVHEVAASTELYAGAFEGRPGGMIVFRATDLDAANRLCSEDPLVGKGYYGYDLYAWDIVLASGQQPHRRPCR